MIYISLRIISFFILSSIIISCSSIGRKQDAAGGKVYAGKDNRELKKEYSINGTVFDTATRKPVAGARVEIKNANMGIGYYLMQTDSSGRFEIKDFIPQLNYIIEIEAEGYVTYLSGGAISPGSHDIYLDREAIINGYVKDSGGRPIPDAEIKLQRGYSGDYSSGIRRPIVIMSDKNGEYKFRKLVQDTYYINFSRPGYITDTAAVKYIKSGESFSLPMQLFKPAAVYGRIVITGEDAPAVNINVVAKGQASISAVTYHDGSYQLADMKPGRYSLEVYHEGFYKLKPLSLDVEEGSEKKGVDFTVSPRNPEVKIYTYKYTFAPGNKVSFNLRTFRTETVKAAVYRVPIETFLKGKSDPNDVLPAREDFKVAAAWDESIQDFKPYEWRYQTIDLKDPLPTGGYCMEVRGPGKVFDRKYFTVTSVGVVVKRSQYRIVAYATDLVTSLPLEDAPAVIFDSTPEKESQRRSGGARGAPERIEDLPINIIARGSTDKNGIFDYKLNSDKHLSILVMGNDGSYALCSTGSPSLFQREQTKYMVYTERPVYRAGDTVYFKIIGKKRENRFVPLAGGTVYYKIINRDTMKEIRSGEYGLDGWGTAHDSVSIDPDGTLGVYEIRVGSDRNNLYGHGKFYVEQYRKPEFKIDITPSKEYFVNGDSVEFKVEGKYFFGAPIKNGVVRYRFYETQLRDTDTKYWWEEDQSDDGRSYKKLKLEGEKSLDENGIAALSLFTGNLPYDREISLEATVVDRSNVSITSIGSVRVGRGEYYIKIQPKQNFYAGNEKKEVEVMTLTQTGKPVSARVTLDLYRYIWKPYQRIYVHDRRPYFSARLETDAAGTAVVDLPAGFHAFGEFDIVVTGYDAKNNPISASRVVWIYDQRGGAVSSRFRNLELSVNSSTMERPGKLTCLLKSRFPDGHVLLTVEGKDVYHTEVVKMKGNVTPVKVEVKGDYAPNFYVTATMQQKRALFTSTAGISLPVIDTGLKIAVEPDKEKYIPGGKAGITVMVTDEKGLPVEADVSLSAVDESIYHIRHDHTPKMQDFFYSKISNWVLTGYSYPITILAGAGKDGKVKIRENFKDTAFWKADIRTDSSGRGRVSIELPDNLTTWRLTARGHDKAGRMGERKKNFMVTQDLIARIGRPRFMVEGDDLGLIGIVNSNTGRGLPKVDINMTADGKKLPAEGEGGVSLPNFGSARTIHNMSVPSGTGSVSLQLTAIADREAKDGLKLSVPVEKRGSGYKFYNYGDMVNNRNVDLQPLKETDDFNFVPESLVISFNPSPVIQMIKSAKFLVEYPYGCVEQTINRFLPVLALHELLRGKNMTGLLDEKTLRELPDMAAKGIARLETAQNDDGSWGWWAGERGNEFITGYAIITLHLAEKFGYRIGSNTVKRGLGAVKRMLDEDNAEDNDAKAFLLYIYSLKGGWSQKAYKGLSLLKEQNPYRLAFMLKSLSVLNPLPALKGEEKKEMLDKRDAMKADLLTRLMGMQKKDDRGIYWASGEGQNWGWPGGDTEITAHVLSALTDAGDKSAIPAQIVRSLSKRARGGSWYTTKQTASVILSISEYLKGAGGITGESASVDFKLNGEKVASFNYNSAGSLHKDDLIKKIVIPREKTSDIYRISADGNAGSDASFDVTLQGVLYFKPSGFLSIFKSEERSLGKLSNGIRMFRTFSGITRVMDMNRNEYLVPVKLDDSRKINVGDELLVKIKFTASDDFEYLVLEDYLPSGFEVINRNAYDANRPYVREERWDNRMVFFFNGLEKGKVYEVAYIIRAELQGKFMVRPSRMECMYEPVIQGWSAPVIIMVQPR